MMQKVTRQLVGYDPETDAVALEYEIPTETWPTIRGLVAHNDDDPEYIYTYPLAVAVANDIACLLGKPGGNGLNFFLECEAASNR